MNTMDAIGRALELYQREGIEFTSLMVAERAEEILSSSIQAVRDSKGYDSLSAKCVKRSMNPLFKEQHAAISKLATSTASEYLSEGRDVWRFCKNNAERNVATIVYNEIRERITRGFK